MIKNDKLSIIICTYNRANLLKECLESLCHQTRNVSDFHVIVVDNNSTDNTREVVFEFNKRISRLYYILEINQGLSYARNRGWRESTTKWIAYLDDDACAFPDYLERILEVIEKGEFDCIGGVYYPWYKYGRPYWYKDSYASNAGKTEGLLEKDFVSGGNLIIKRSILEKFGGFSASVGMTGKTIAYGEETRLQIIMRRAGFKIGFEPNIKIKHLVPTYKQNLLWFYRASYAIGRDIWDTFLIERTISKLSSMIVSGGINCIKAFVIGAGNCFREKDYFIQNWFIDVIRPFALTIGIMRGYLMSK